MERRYCTQCGYELNKGDAFCSKCGRPVPKPSSILKATVVGKRHPWLRLLLACIALLIVGVIGFVILVSLQGNNDSAKTAVETTAEETMTQTETAEAPRPAEEESTVVEETTEAESTTVEATTLTETNTEAESSSEPASETDSKTTTSQKDEETTESTEEAITTRALEVPVYDFVGHWEVVITVPAEGVNWDLVEKVMGSEIPDENRTGIVQSFRTELVEGEDGLTMTYAPEADIIVDGNKLYMTIPDQAFVYIVDALMMEDQLGVEGSVDVMMLGQKYASGSVEIQRLN